MGINEQINVTMDDKFEITTDVAEYDIAIVVEEYVACITTE